ncbi:DUF2000 domain-containing protein [Streptomonospora wellingtoniae]|uniref:DUF2000 domain-containing protein n=1 Tax=Streptomonospora wellingtoniae TaxID=3075544 RepID=A0ABU2KNC6_9ACTN|nr:DUF2000 domain-containing protein [Streptomonospora sp. DSM 45055]MDT0300770.1 DUF2000 domain-containing protein [Streptomonospora sp. DSM 45055]
MSDQLTRPEPAETPPFRLEPDDIDIDTPTRGLPVKWVMVVDRDLEPGLVANTASCLAAAVGRELPRMIGPGGFDASGGAHRGLPWTGCTVLGGDAAEVGGIRAKALSKSGLLVVDMPSLAQVCRVYSGYLEALAEAGADDIRYHGVALVGPRNKVDKIVGRLPLFK